MSNEQSRADELWDEYLEKPDADKVQIVSKMTHEIRALESALASQTAEVERLKEIVDRSEEISIERIRQFLESMMYRIEHGNTEESLKASAKANRCIKVLDSILQRKSALQHRVGERKQ